MANMSSTSISTEQAPEKAMTEYSPHVRRAYNILHFGFVAAPLIAGLDKFFNILVDWNIYLSPTVARLFGAEGFMRFAGVVEIAAGILCIFRPQIAGYVIAVWLWGIIINLLSIPGYFDIALRDFGLSLGALALANLSRACARHERDS